MNTSSCCSECGDPAEPPMWDIHLCFKHWCERESYVPTHTVTRAGKPIVVPGGYVSRPRSQSPDHRATDILKGRSLESYQKRASDEGWVREGGYWACWLGLPEHRGQGCSCYERRGRST